MGVWMEAESTVMTVSQGINRPNGANTALNFFGRRNARRTVGKQTDGRERWGLVRGNHRQRRGFRKSDGGDDDEGKSLAPTWAAADNKACIGRTTDCTTWGLSVALVARAVTLIASSADGLCLRRTLKMISAAANSAIKAMSLPVLVLKKLRRARR